MDDALMMHRLHFAFTITFHYLFPQLTMGLTPLIVLLKTMYLRTNNHLYNRAARFWAKVFGISFLMGVVTGIPMEFQFGTNWAPLCAIDRRRDWPAAGDGRRLFVFPGVGVPWAFSLWREKAEQDRPLVGGIRRVYGLVAVRLFHRRDGRVDAASGRLSTRRGRQLSGHELLGPAAESVGADSVFAQHVRRAHYGHVRDGGRRRILPARG